jgi:hypothetical protein
MIGRTQSTGSCVTVFTGPSSLWEEAVCEPCVEIRPWAGLEEQPGLEHSY